MLFFILGKRFQYKPPIHIWKKNATSRERKKKRNIQYLAVFNWFIEKMLLLISHSFVTMFIKIGPKVSKMKINYSSSDRIRFCCCSSFFFSVIDVDLVIVVVIGYSAPAMERSINDRTVFFILRVYLCVCVCVYFPFGCFQMRVILIVYALRTAFRS